MKLVRFGKFVINMEEISNITYEESRDIADKEKVLAIIDLKNGTRIKLDFQEKHTKGL